MNCVLLLGRDRRLLTRAAKQATYAFLTFLAGAAACAVLAQTNGPAQLLPIAFGLGLWAMAAGLTHLLAPGQQKVVWLGTAAAVLLTAMAIAAILAAAPGATFAVALVLLSGIAAAWFTALAN
jgi:hypothetical protein